MYCKNCGKQNPDDANYCTNCGSKLDDEIIRDESPKKATFKEGTMALFNKLFVFEGRSSRSEFNYGLLFLMIVTSILSSVLLTPQMFEVLAQFEGDMALFGAQTEALFTSKDIFDVFNLYSIGVSIIFSIFLSAPVFRRLSDFAVSRKWAIELTVVFVISELLSSTLLWCLLPTNLYQSLSGLFDILSLANSVILLFCVFKQSQN